MATPNAPPSLVGDISSMSEPDELPLSELQGNERCESLKQFSDFSDAVYKSLEELIVNRRFGSYESVHVLFLAWNNPPIPEIEELEQVFKNTLQFTTERYDITSEGLEDSLKLKLDAVVRRYAGVDELLIIYYAGHGRSEMDGNTTTWQPTRHLATSDDILQRPLNWGTIEDRLNQSIAKDSDILYIVDSDYKARTYPVGPSGGNKGLLGTSQAADDYWYTRDLIDELQDHFGQSSSISQSALHSRMKQRQTERNIPEPYNFSLFQLARSTSIELASMTDAGPREPPMLRNVGHSDTICMIQVDYSAEPDETPEIWFERKFNDGKTVDKDGVKAHPIEYVRRLDDQAEGPYYQILALMPSELSRKIVKKLDWPAFAELETVPSQVPISETVWNSALRKWGRLRLR